jgi:hypothetical protein
VRIFSRGGVEIFFMLRITALRDRLFRSLAEWPPSGGVMPADDPSKKNPATHDCLRLPTRD